MKLVSFNVNGIRAAAGKGLVNSLRQMDADIFCFQETKATPGQVAEALAELEGYQVHAYGAQKPGYSGTAIVCRTVPSSLSFGIGVPGHDDEGRVVTATFDDVIVVNVYTPNSGQELKRLDYRQEWDGVFRAYIIELAKDDRPVIVCGDLNVAHRDIDLARPKANFNKSAGYMQEEIDGMDALLSADMVDSFRYLHPEEVKYSWWSFRAGARGRNVGWRIDYVLVSAGFEQNVKDAFILNEVLGSDHCPVGIAW